MGETDLEVNPGTAPGFILPSHGAKALQSHQMAGSSPGGTEEQGGFLVQVIDYS